MLLHNLPKFLQRSGKNIFSHFNFSTFVATFKNIKRMSAAGADADAGAAAATSSELPVVTFVTGNAKKLEELVAILSAGNSQPLPFRVVNVKLDLPELQGEPEYVSIEKCKLAADQLKGPVIVEDTSLCFNALGGLPGVYIKWFLDKTGHEGLNNIITAYSDKSGYAQCIFSFSAGPGADVETFVGRCSGTIVPARGPKDFGWDPIFQPDTFDKTFAELDKDTKNAISHRSKSVALLKAFLSEKYKKT
jgi:inosine triphosphate pyrophosphatase